MIATVFVHPINLPPEEMVYIEFYDLDKEFPPGSGDNGLPIGREFGVRENYTPYEKQIDRILQSPRYNDLLQRRIVVFVRSYHKYDELLYIKSINPQ